MVNLIFNLAGLRITWETQHWVSERAFPNRLTEEVEDLPFM